MTVKGCRTEDSRDPLQNPSSLLPPLERLISFCAKTMASTYNLTGSHDGVVGINQGTTVLFDLGKVMWKTTSSSGS